MSLFNSDVDAELSCYIKLIDCYLKNQKDYFKKQLCKNKSIIKLMRCSDYKKKNKESIKNSLIFVLSLFEDENKPPDLYSTIGKDIEATTDKEQNVIISILKKEFL